MRLFYPSHKKHYKNYFLSENDDFGARARNATHKITPALLTSGTNMTGRREYWTMEMNGGSSASCLARSPCVPLFYTYFTSLETEEPLAFQGRAGITSTVRWNLHPVIFGVDHKHSQKVLILARTIVLSISLHPLLAHNMISSSKPCCKPGPPARIDCHWPAMGFLASDSGAFPTLNPPDNIFGRSKGALCCACKILRGSCYRG